MRTALIVIGVLLELGGVTLLALDVLAAPTKEAWHHVRTDVSAVWRRTQRAAWRLWNRLRRRTVVTVTSGGAMAGGITPTGHVSARVIPGPESEKFPAWVRQELLELGDRLAAVETAATRHREATNQKLHDQAVELRAAIDAAVLQSEGAYRSWRLIGFALALTGVTLTLIGGLMHA